MAMSAPEWHEPRSLDEALSLRAEHGEEATVVAGGAFLGIVMNQKLFAPTRLVALRSVPELDYIEADGEKLMLGAMATHRAVERSPVVKEAWPSLAFTFSVVASPRVRNQATVGGVVADADYASDPPSMLAALEARVVARSVRGEREIPMDEFVLDHYETALEEDELVTELRIPRSEGRLRLPQVPLALKRGSALRLCCGGPGGRRATGRGRRGRRTAPVLPGDLRPG